IALIKTEPIEFALLGFIFLGDKVTPPMIAAILVATAGVIVMSTKPRQGGRDQTYASGFGIWRSICSRSDRISRRDPQSWLAGLFHGGDVHPRDRTRHPICRAVALSVAAPADRDVPVVTGLEPVAIRGFYGRARIAILVSRLCAGDRGKRANAGAGGSSIRAARRALWLWPTHDAARGNRHGLCRVRRGASVIRVLNASSAPGKGAPQAPAFEISSCRPAAPARGETRSLPRATAWLLRATPRHRWSGVRPRHNESFAPLRESAARHNGRSW